MEYLKNLYKQQPLRIIVLCGLLFRIIAVIFSKGFGMHDDHFLVIEAGQSFADGSDYNKWLPWHNNYTPSGHSWFYVGIHFILFKILNFIGLDDPQGKMYVIRLIHALYSLLVITIGYKITRKLSSEKDALNVAWLLSLLWLIPSASVRNLVEWVCVPTLLLSSFYLIKSEEGEGKNKYTLLSGLFAGLSMAIRFQSIFFVFGIFLYLLIRKEIKAGIILFASLFATFFLTQSVDLFFYHRAFAELTEYITYNFKNSTTYFNSPFYTYVLTMLGFLIPPVSIFMIAGYVKASKRLLILFIPSLTFFLFHSYFPNKQERFILPFIPYLIIVGTVGWAMIREGKAPSKFNNGSWKFFWVLNILGLFVLSTTYSKRSMVEAMYYLYKQPDFDNFVMEVSHRDNAIWPPQFYTGKWNNAYCISGEYPLSKFEGFIQAYPDSMPKYVLFFQEDDLWNRIARFKYASRFELKYVYTAQPSSFDALLHWLNPHNKNEPIFIFKTEKLK
jgi:hypothetical protein